MYITVDLEKCQGYANCVTAAEDVFDIDDDGKVVVLRGEVGDDVAAVEAAARSCPVFAITLEN